MWFRVKYRDHWGKVSGYMTWAKDRDRFIPWLNERGIILEYVDRLLIDDKERDPQKWGLA